VWSLEQRRPQITTIAIIVFQRTSRGDWQEDDPGMDDHEDGDGERWDLAGHVDGSMMIIRNVQASYQTIWSIGFIVVSTASTLESLFELSYRIPKLFT
jgi:hypothetical protein